MLKKWEVSETGDRLNGIAFTLIGVTNMLSAIGLAIILLTISGFLETLGGVALNYNVTIPTFTTYLGVGWGFTILQLIAGFVAMFAGIALLTKPKETK